MEQGMADIGMIPPRGLAHWRCPPVQVGKDILIRVVDPADVDGRYPEGLNDPAVSRFLATSGQPHTIDSVRHYVAANLAAQDCALLGLFVENRLVGTARIHDATRGNAWIGIAMFDARHRGRGFGGTFLNAASNIAIEQLGIHQLCAGIAPQNAASLATFAACGFGRHLRLSLGEIWRKAAPDRVLAAQYVVERGLRLADDGQATREDVATDLAMALLRFPENMKRSVRDGFSVADSIVYRHPGLSSASYLRHCLRVLQLYGDWADELFVEGIHLSLLHNTQEVGTAVDWSTMRMSDAVRNAIGVLTVDRKQQWDVAYKQSYYERIASSPRWIGQVKIVDKMDNLFVLGLNPDDDIRRRYLSEIENHVIPLARLHLPHAERYLYMMVENARRLGHFARPSKAPMIAAAEAGDLS